MSSVVGRTVVEVRVTLAVTTGRRRGRPGHRRRRHRTDAARPPVERVARVALERRRQPGPDQPAAGHGALAIPPSERVGGLDRRAGGAGRPLEQAELLALAEVRRGDPEQPDADAADLGPGKLERRVGRSARSGRSARAASAGG